MSRWGSDTTEPENLSFSKIQIRLKLTWSTSVSDLACQLLELLKKKKQSRLFSLSNLTHATTSIDDSRKKQMHSGQWGLSRETTSLLHLSHDHFSFGIFFCLIPLPIPQCIAKSSNAIDRLFQKGERDKI